MIFYEAPHRLAATLKDAREILGEREAVVARELTKLHEEIRHGLLGELAMHYGVEVNPRGEIVLLIDRNTIKTDEAPASDPTKTVTALVERLE